MIPAAYGFFSATTYRARAARLRMTQTRNPQNRWSVAPYVLVLDWQGRALPATHTSPRPFASEIPWQVARSLRNMTPYLASVDKVGDTLWLSQFPADAPDWERAVDVPDGVLLGRLRTMLSHWTVFSFVGAGRDAWPDRFAEAEARLPGLLARSDRMAALAGSAPDPWADPRPARRRARR